MTLIDNQEQYKLSFSISDNIFQVFINDQNTN